MNSVRELSRLLRDKGWKKEYSKRASVGCLAITSYQKTLQDRILTVQLWGDMNHRVSRGALNHSQSEYPTDFRTEQEMWAAIKLQSEQMPVYERKV